MFTFFSLSHGIASGTANSFIAWNFFVKCVCIKKCSWCQSRCLVFISYKGSMVPFPLRLLHAQLPLHLNNSLLALNRTCVLQNTTQRILGLIKQGKLPLNDEGLTPDEQGVAQEVWLSRLVHVKFALCRCLLEVGVSLSVKNDWLCWGFIVCLDCPLGLLFS